MKRKTDESGDDEGKPKCPFLHQSVEAASSTTIEQEPRMSSPTLAIPNSSSPDSVTKALEGQLDMENEDDDEEEDSWAIEPKSTDWLLAREFSLLEEAEGANPEVENGVEEEEELTSDEEGEFDQHSDESFDSDVPDEEIEAMLEEGLPDEFKGKKKEGPQIGKDVVAREKIVLDEKGRNHFDVLPEGWVSVTHNSGMPVYLHKKTRVCTLSFPYFLGPGSARKHEIPLSAIPCLHYNKAKESEAEEMEKWKQRKQEAEAKAAEDNTSVQQCIPNAKIETVQENKVINNLNAMQIREYCSRLFNFKTIQVMRFSSWSARRTYTKQKRRQRQLVQRPSLPAGTKLITVPIKTPENEGADRTKNSRREWVMNPTGKSYVCILHEYVQHALKRQPSYSFKELENAATPYSACVLINDMQYGQGFGTSKKQAKSEAAKATLEILIPEMRDKIQQDARGSKKIALNKEPDGLSFFDEIKIEDPRVTDLCYRTCEPSPYSILLVCLQRNFGVGDMQVKYEVNTVSKKRNEFTMTVGKHTVKVACKNKKDGKQQASQAILQLLHPFVTSWGSLLRMYGTRSVKTVREKKQEEQEITVLQNKATANAPNYAIIEKLKHEMNKLKDQQGQLQPIGKFVAPVDVGVSALAALPSTSAADTNNVDL